jgi:RNA polymerase sigma-70 factor (ECF subfamily)
MAAPDFSTIYETYHGRVLAYVSRLIGREQAEDIAQDVFVKVRRSLDTLADDSKVSPWIYSITLNAVRDAIRARVARREPPAGSDQAAHHLTSDDAPDVTARTPEETAMRREMIACYLEFVGRLPPRYHQVYALSEFEGLPNEEIARRLSLTLGTVKIRLHRARATLNDELRRHCRCWQNERGELMGDRKPT